MKQPQTHVLIQARMGSSRLPGKVLMPFTGGFTFLEWSVERLKTSAVLGKVIVATSTLPKDDAIEELCKQKGYDYFRGSEDDVLMRFAGAAEKFDSQIIVRGIADCPLVDVKEMDRSIGILESEGLEYANNHPGGLPLGTGTEVFTRAAFTKVIADAKDPYDHEHVTPYFYRNVPLFTQKEIKLEAVHPFAPEARFVLDYPEDRDFLVALAKAMQITDPKNQPSTNEILDFLQNHPELVAINKGMAQKTFPKA